MKAESLRKKKGWACYKLGRSRQENNDFEGAERAFNDAIVAFNNVSDHHNIILCNCNLGRGRRALAESIVSKAGTYRSDGPDAALREQLLETAKNEYCKSLAYYAAARSELRAAVDRHVTVPDSLLNDLNSQVAQTYLRLGMLLARDNSSAEVYESINIDTPNKGSDNSKKGLRKHEILADEAFREAISAYESLGDLRRQEAAFAYFQLASYHRDCCLRYVIVDTLEINLPRDDGRDKAKQYASLAQISWQKSIDFYGPESHPDMHLIILMELSRLSSQLSSSFQLNAMLESALSHLLKARHVNDAVAEKYEATVQFWVLLRDLLKSMVSIAIKLPADSTASSNGKFDVGKLKELYRMSLRSTRLSELNAMYVLWSSY